GGAQPARPVVLHIGVTAVGLQEYAIAHQGSLGVGGIVHYGNPAKSVRGYGGGAEEADRVGLSVIGATLGKPQQVVERGRGLEFLRHGDDQGVGVEPPFGFRDRIALQVGGLLKGGYGYGSDGVAQYGLLSSEKVVVGKHGDGNLARRHAGQIGPELVFGKVRDHDGGIRAGNEGQHGGFGLAHETGAFFVPIHPGQAGGTAGS